MPVAPFPVFETPRLLLRPFQPTDVDATFPWFSDPEVMRFIPFGPDSTQDQTAARIARYIAHGDKYGFSKWLIVEKENGLPVGDSGLFYLPDQRRVELGYRIARAHWGRGLATEAALAWLSVARPWFGLKKLHGFAHPDNHPSLHILCKIGFHSPVPEVLYDVEVMVHHLDLAG